MEREFLGVWIPREIWLNEDLNWTEKLLLVEIKSLARNGECFASNDHFAKFLRLSKRRVSEVITDLNRAGLISVELVYKKDSKEIEKRIIRPIAENSYTPSEKPLDPHEEKRCTPLAEKCVDNNTSFNNTINNTINNTKKINKKEKSAEFENEFEILWKAYPRKQGNKKKARDSYIKARKAGSVTFEEAKFGLDSYIKYIEYHRVSEEYIKHGATWFNQEAWNNEYTIKPKAVQGKRSGFLGLVLNEMDYQRSAENIVDYEGEIINGQERNSPTFSNASNALPFRI